MHDGGKTSYCRLSVNATFSIRSNCATDLVLPASPTFPLTSPIDFPTLNTSNFSMIAFTQDAYQQVHLYNECETRTLAIAYLGVPEKPNPPFNAHKDNEGIIILIAKHG
jgi:hypothetical protein